MTKNRIIGILFCFVLSAIILHKIFGYNFIPVDDALRHTGKAVTSKSWPDILKIEPGAFTMDFQFGWERLLKLIHKCTGANQDDLLTFSVTSMFLMFCVTGFLLFKKPISWLAAILLVGFIAGLGDRLLYGRPFVITLSALVFVLMQWFNAAGRKPQVTDVVYMALAIGLGCFMHGTWYLWSIVVLAFFLSGEIEWCKAVGLSWLIGVVTAAVLTGSPLTYISAAVDVVMRATGTSLQRVLASELQPHSNQLHLIIIFGCYLHAKYARKVDLLKSPIFILTILGWTSAFVAERFWADWGLIALIILIAIEIQHVFENSESLKQNPILATLACGTICYFGISSDVDSRWSGDIIPRYRNLDKLFESDWKPGNGGIIYSTDMRLFYSAFHEFPNANWRYCVGFEPALMPAKDYMVFKTLGIAGDAPAAYTPWIKEMRPEDRLFIKGTRPDSPLLEWTNMPAYSVGRLKQPKQSH